MIAVVSTGCSGFRDTAGGEKAGNGYIGNSILVMLNEALDKRLWNDYITRCIRPANER